MTNVRFGFGTMKIKVTMGVHNVKNRSITGVICVATILAALSACREKNAEPTLAHTNSFAAVIVADLDKSVQWYQDIFGLAVRSNAVAGDARIAILGSGEFELELLELGSVSRDEAVRVYPAGTLIQGLFKIGFRTKDLNGWTARLRDLQVVIPQIYTDSETGKRNFLIQDPDGNYIQFFE